MTKRAEYWNAAYEKRPFDKMSWFQAEAQTSLELIAACNVALGAAILDVGAGASRLVDGLLARGYHDITLLDVADRALDTTRHRLPDAPVEYVVADVTTWKPPRRFDLWHDRAVFHFLTEAADRAAYRRTLAAAVPTGGHVILGTFAEDGPDRCSGLPVQRYSAASLADALGDIVTPIESRNEQHITPAGTSQSFIFVRFCRN